MPRDLKAMDVMLMANAPVMTITTQETSVTNVHLNTTCIMDTVKVSIKMFVQ